MITGAGNYLIESNGKLTPICSSVFSLVKTTNNRQHFCLNFETGISVPESSDIIESSWVLTLDEVLDSSLVLANFLSANVEPSGTEEISETIIYDGVSALPPIYYNITKPNVPPSLGDTLFVSKNITVSSGFSDNSSNLEKNHKFYGTFFDNSGAQYIIQINKMRRISGVSLSTESSTSVSFITDTIITKQK